MKYKKWISETDIRQPEDGEIVHCILMDIEGKLPPYQEIMKYNICGFQEQYERVNRDDIPRFRVVYWRSIPDFPDLSEMHRRIGKKIRN